MRNKIIGIVAACALAVSGTTALAQAKKKDRCKDGESDTVASYTIAKGENLDHAINASLTGSAGDPKAGLKWITHRRLGNCIACHEVSKILELADPSDIGSLKKYGFHGKIAPTLDGVASRYTEGELRMLVVNPKKIFPETIMPGFHVKDGLTRVIADCEGLAILTPERVEDIIAYLKTLTDK